MIQNFFTLVLKTNGQKLYEFTDKTINWIECKCQQTYGSIGEKLQTPRNKIRNLKWRFPNWEINYFYILDHKFKDLCPQEISDLDFDNVPYIFDNEQDFEQKLLNMIK